MAKNWVQKGHTVTFTAPTGGVTVGVLLMIGAMAVVPDANAAEAETFEGHLEGVWDFQQKTLADTPAEGAPAYFDVSAGEITTVATDNKLIGAFISSGGNGSAACRVRLNGVAVA